MNNIEATEPTTAVEASEPSTNGDDELRAEMIRDRFDAAAARAGVDVGYVDVALKLFQDGGTEPTRDNMSSFISTLKKEKPALFASRPANTAPLPPAPATPSVGALDDPYTRWRSLEESGQRAEAEAHYRLHRRQILRSPTRS